MTVRHKPGEGFFFRLFKTAFRIIITNERCGSSPRNGVQRSYPGRLHPAWRRGNKTMNRRRAVPLLFILVCLCGCATLATGPSIAVLPGPGKPFEAFQTDDSLCRQWAAQQTGGASPGQTANQSAAGGGALGAIVEAGLGAAIGAATGNVGAGAGTGLRPARALPLPLLPATLSVVDGYSAKPPVRSRSADEAFMSDPAMLPFMLTAQIELLLSALMVQLLMSRINYWDFPCPALDGSPSPKT
jgi:hypothetical protein